MDVRNNPAPSKPNKNTRDANDARHESAQVEWAPVREGGQLYERIAAQIEELITKEHLRSGDQLPPERVLAELLGVSRPSVREAVKTLVARDRLQVTHGRGVFVSSPRSGPEMFRAALSGTEVGLRELFAMRLVLEVPAAGWAADNRSASDLRELRTVLETLESASAESIPDFDVLKQLDATFHFHIASAARNPFLERTLGVLQEMLSMSMDTTLRIPGRLERSEREHRQIYDAIEAGDASEAQRAMRKHLREVEAAALRPLRRTTHA